MSIGIEPRSQMRVRPASRGRSVLLVEDDPVDRDLVTRRLTKGGWLGPVRVASTLAQARQRLQSISIDYLLLDNALPDGNGIDLAMEISADPTFRDMKVFVVSDWPTPLLWEKAKAAGVISVIKKSEFAVAKITQNGPPIA